MMTTMMTTTTTIMMVMVMVMTTRVLCFQIHQEVGVVRKAYWCIKNHTEQKWIITFEMYMLTLLFIVPLLIMILAYSVIAVKVWRVSDIRTGG